MKFEESLPSAEALNEWPKAAEKMRLELEKIVRGPFASKHIDGETPEELKRRQEAIEKYGKQMIEALGKRRKGSKGSVIMMVLRNYGVDYDKIKGLQP